MPKYKGTEKVRLPHIRNDIFFYTRILAIIVERTFYHKIKID